MAMRTLLALLGVVVAAASTWIGTLVAAFVVLGALTPTGLPWWVDFPLTVVFCLVWYWGGFFLSMLLMGLSTYEPEPAPMPRVHNRQGANAMPPENLEDQLAFVERYERERPDPPAGVELPPGFGYVHFKAWSLLDRGADSYRAQDALSMPPADLSPGALDVLERGCEQLVQWRGISADRCLEGLGIPGFYLLVRFLHYEVGMQAAMRTEDGRFIDRMTLRHVVKGDELVLFNLV